MKKSERVKKYIIRLKEREINAVKIIKKSVTMMNHFLPECNYINNNKSCMFRKKIWAQTVFWMAINLFLSELMIHIIYIHIHTYSETVSVHKCIKIEAELKNLCSDSGKYVEEHLPEDALYSFII